MKKVLLEVFFFSSCFIDLIPNFVSNIGFRISRWRETELKGNPVQIRNYPRSCKFYPPIVWGSVVTFLATGYCENREALQRKQVRRPAVIVYIIHGFRVKGDRTNHTDPFILVSMNCRV